MSPGLDNNSCFEVSLSAGLSLNYLCVSCLWACNVKRDMVVAANLLYDTGLLHYMFLCLET